jgi:PhzF family phenazine biosynthesis protein
MNQFIQVDAFTEKPYTGNPASVCVLQKEAPHAWMQAVASEMNLSETAFLVKQVNNTYHLRWFTPTMEVNLCGHATLASAHVLWEEGYLPTDETILFETRSGLLSARKANGWISLDFPIDRSKPFEAPEPLKSALDCNLVNVEKSFHGHLIVEVASEEEVLRLNPNMTLLNKIDAKLIIVTSLSQKEEYQFVSRVFAPRLGIVEDPVTGAAHCALAPYWQTRLAKKFDAKTLPNQELTAYQASKRGGVVKTQIFDNDRVILKGQAVTVFKGEILFDVPQGEPLALSHS